MIRIRTNIKDQNIVSASVLLFFILDTINFIIDQHVGLNAFNSVSVYGKAAVEVIALLTILRRKGYNRELLLISMLIVLPVCGYLISCIKTNVFENDVFFIVLKQANKYVFAIILYLWIKSINVNWKKLQTLFEAIFLFSALIVIIAFIFDLEYFFTYNKNRFGFKPALSTQNEITLFWMIGITYFGQQYFSNKNDFNVTKLLLILLAASILGTKAILLFISCYVAYVLVTQSRLSFGKITISVITTLLLLSLFVYVTGIFSFFFELHENHGLLYAITSSRSIYVEQYVIPLFNDFKVWNFFIGGNYFRVPLTEMDLIDAFFFLGIVGVMIYFYLLRRTIFAFNKNNITGIFFVSQYVLIGGVAGHIFTSGINAMYLAILLLYLQKHHLKSIEL